MIHVVEALGQLNGTIAAEIVQDDGIAVLDRSCRVSVLVRNDEAGKVLIRIAAFLTVGFDGFPGGAELPSVAEHVNMPALLYHGPVRLIAVHGDHHASAAGCDAGMEALIIDALQIILDLIHILQGRGLGNVTAIEESVNADLFDSFLLRFPDHGDQVMNIGMYIAIGQKTDEVQLTVVLLHIVDTLLPCVRLINRAGFNRLIDQLGTLGIDLTAAQRVVAYLGIAHVGIRGKSYRCSGCLDCGMRPLRHQLIDLGLVGMHYGIAVVLVRPADTIHHYQYYRFAHWVLLILTFLRRTNCFRAFPKPCSCFSGSWSVRQIFNELPHCNLPGRDCLSFPARNLPPG